MRIGAPHRLVGAKALTGKPVIATACLPSLILYRFKGSGWLEDLKLTVRADLPGATFHAPVPRAPALDLCPGGLATTNAQ